MRSGQPASKLVIQCITPSFARQVADQYLVTGTCECVSYLGPGLGGGHGWLQGHHGLIADQFTSMNVVLANGDLKTIDAQSDLWWAMQGAGHNFGIVTSVTSKTYDIENTDWAIETIVLSGDKVEAIYEAANNVFIQNGTQSAKIHNWSYWQNDATLDPEKVRSSLRSGMCQADMSFDLACHHHVHHPRGCDSCGVQIHQAIP